MWSPPFLCGDVEPQKNCAEMCGTRMCSWCISLHGGRSQHVQSACNSASDEASTQ